MSSGTSGDIRQVRATLDAWRAQGADRVNLTRYRFIDALERRAAGYDGDARRVLDERLATLIAAYADEIERADGVVKTANAAATLNATPARNTLRDLVNQMHIRRAATEGGNDDASTARAASRGLHSHASPDLPVLDFFRETWSKVSAEKQLRQALERVPGNAGPLNSNSLVHRSLALMRECSPGYLQQFLSYVDALAWMEQLAGPIMGNHTPTPTATAEPPRAASAKKGARGKSR
ncbi:DUF2894 domain-containing protein [Paraburkholderia phosphatilytica]|uniref:DUF2894 domain-containing protein n=1 Tax=Paraburkholderia phosphatilytica TaxID=2282883 RepID=UPI000E53C0CE|nr:DUF2894 domain-containing protein [Paraburkholderia phosphatilytica]